MSAEQKPWRILEPGKVYFHHGPSSIMVMADRDGRPLTALCCQAFEAIDAALKEIAASLEPLRQPPERTDASRLGGLPRAMLEAVLAVGEPTLTPMAAVAGCVSDAVADWLFEQGATRAMVNNGGDVALRLAPGTSVKLGVMTSLAEGKVDRAVTVRAEDGIGGCATSGLGGRSLTRGIASGVSVFSKRCVLADALATHLANCSFIQSKEVKVARAGELDQASDIAGLNVVVGVGKLGRPEIRQALRQIEREAERQRKKNNLVAVCARVRDRILDFNMPVEDSSGQRPNGGRG